MAVNDPRGREARQLSLLTAAGSVVFTVVLFVGYWLSGSDLALAQAADSLLDGVALGVLAWTVQVARIPADEDHPFGHTPAEPIGALVTAVFAGVLGFEVGRSAISSLLAAEPWEPVTWLLPLFGAKAVFKLGVFLAARRTAGSASTPSPAMRAMMVDARNDIATSLLAVGGYFAAQRGYPWMDAVLALPLALWILYSGIDLARENIHLLMGAAPPVERQEELTRLVQELPGVLDAHHLRAHYLGAALFVHVHVVVDGEHSLRAAHDIAEGVRKRVEAEKDIVSCSVHIDVLDDETLP